MALSDAAFKEDGYYDFNQLHNRASQVLISQLPKKHLDSLLDNEAEDEEEDKPTTSLRRKDSQYRTIQLKNAILNSHRKNLDAEKVYQLLNADPNVSKEEKIERLREMRQSLTIKRQVKEKLDADQEKKIASRPLGSCAQFKFILHRTLYTFLYKFKNLCYSFELFNYSLKTIQGQFGSSVASYFFFLRWLLYLNICNFAIIFCFVVIPETIHHRTSDFPTYLGNKSQTFEVHNLLTGKGWFMDSLLYFGAYSSQKIQFVPRLSYNMPLAYLTSIAVIMLISLIAVSFSITAYYQKNYVDTAGEIKSVFCNKIFSAWDYAIETKSAAFFHKRMFCNAIRELLYSKRLSKRRMTNIQKVTFAVVNLFSIAVVISASYVIYYFLKHKSVAVNILILKHLTFALTVTILSSAFFYLLKFFTVFEVYLSKKMTLYFTMIRVIILRAILLGIIVYFWMVVYKPPRDQQVCYEAELGSEFYRLILVNFLVSVLILTVFGEFVRKLIHIHVTSRMGLKEFDVAYDTLDLIHFQTFAWLAIFCVPMVSLLIIVILVLLFYIKMISMSYNCRPPKGSLSVHEMQTFYLLLTFLMFFLSTITVAYTIFSVETSYCGPLKDYEYAGSLLGAIFFKEGTITSIALKTITSQVFLLSVFFVMCLFVHFIRAKANAHRLLIEKMRETLILESKDKAFLLNLFDDAFIAHQNNKTVQDKNINKNAVQNLQI